MVETPSPDESRPAPRRSWSMQVLADLGLEAAGAIGRVVYALVAVGASLGAFFAAGAYLDLWSAALGFGALLAFCLLGRALWRLHRYSVAAVFASVGAGVALAVDAGSPVGGKVMVVAGLLAVVALFWSIVEVAAS